MDKEEDSKAGAVPQEPDVPQKLVDAARPRRASNPTEKGRDYNVSVKTKLFWYQKSLLGKAISAAVKELSLNKPNQETLVKCRERISHMRNELSDIESSLRELGSGDVVSEGWGDAKMLAQETISNITSAIAKEASLEKIVKARSRHSSRSASHRSASSKASGVESQRSATSSIASLKLHLKVEAAALGVKCEGQATEDAQQRQLDSLETQEATRQAQIEAEEAIRQAQIEAEEATRQAKIKVEKAARQAEFECKKRESMSKIETTRLETKIREQQAMINIVEQFEAPPQDPPVLPPINLLESRFDPSPSPRFPSNFSVSPLVNHESVTVGTGQDVAVGAVSGAHQSAISAPPVPVCYAAGAYVAAAPSDVAAVPNFVAGAARGTDSSALPTVPVCYAAGAVNVAASFDDAAVSNVSFAFGANFVAGAARDTGTPALPSVPVSVYDVCAAHACTQLSSAMIYTTASQSTMSTRPPTLLSVLQHPLGVFAAHSSPSGPGLSTSSRAASPRVASPSRPGWCNQLSGISEVTEPQLRHPSSVPYSVDRQPHLDPQPPGHYSVCNYAGGYLRPEAQPFVPTVTGTQQTYAPFFQQREEHPFLPVNANFLNEQTIDPRFRTGMPSATPSHPPAPFHISHDSHLDSLSRTLSDALMLNRLPMQEPCIFTGDPLQYPPWRAAFAFLIERQNIATSEKLLYLQRYLGGQAKEAVAGFFLLRDSEAYEKAMNVLEKRFGNSYVVSQAFRTKLDEWAAVKSRDCIGLRRLADFLQQCAVAAKEVGGLGILDDAHYLKLIVEKLPDWMVHRWSRTVSRIKLTQSRYPHFEELVAFVTLEADISNDPVFGAGALPPSSSKPATSSQQAPAAKKASLATLSEVVTTCDFCNLPAHAISQCDSFAKKPAKEKRDFVFKSCLCFGCLKSKEHKSRQCNDRETCGSCSKKHPTCLHDKDFMYKRQGGRGGDNSKQNSTQTSEPATQSGESQASAPEAVTSVTTLRAHEDGSDGLTSMIVPVYLSSDSDPSNEVLTYALLDTMSNATFVVESLTEDINASSQSTTLKISTLTEDDAFISSRKFSGLRVRSASSSEYIKLPPAIARHHLSLDTAQILTPETVKKHQHLQHLAQKLTPLQPDCHAGLLIGYDCAEALMPLNVVQGLPFAIETKLGWSIVGKSPDSVAFDEIGSSLHVVVKPCATAGEQVTFVYRSQVEEVSCADLLHVLERDFVDSESGSISQDDAKFMKIVKENPADHALRGLRVNDLMSSRWFQGPTFLLQSLPRPDAEFYEIPEDDVEVKVCKATASVEVTFPSFEQIIQRFSTKSSLVRGVAVIVRKCAAKRGQFLTMLQSYEVAEKRLAVCLQKEYFSHPTVSLRKSLQELNTYKDTDGLLRVGGVWQRQIRTVRNVLNGLLRRSGQRLSKSSLRTVLYEVMAIVNSRPLAVESLESPDGPRPLTPNHILTMERPVHNHSSPSRSLRRCRSVREEAMAMCAAVG